MIPRNATSLGGGSSPPEKRGDLTTVTANISIVALVHVRCYKPGKYVLIVLGYAPNVLWHAWHVEVLLSTFFRALQHVMACVEHREYLARKQRSTR